MAGLDRIFSDKKGIINIFNDTYSKFQEQSNKIKKLIDYYKGDTQSASEHLPNSERKFNNKATANFTKVLIDTVVAITLNKPLSYICRKEDENYKKDVDLIVNYMQDESEHNINLETCNDLLVTGVGFQYCLQQDMEEDPTPYSPFTLGAFSPLDTYCVYKPEIGNKILASFHLTSVGNDIIVNAFDDENEYTFKVNDKEITDIKAHGMPNNPIQAFESDKYRLSIVDDLMGLQDSLNISISNYNNSVLLFINQLLVVNGAELEEKDIAENLKKNILNLPSGGDAKFISASITDTILDFMENTIEKMCIISGCPSQKVGNAETGKGVEAENGHTIANFSSNKREQAFYKPKRLQLQNIIEILRRNNKLSSDIEAQDIEIKFDRNRLMSISEHVMNLKTLLVDCKVDPYDALKVCDIFDNVTEVSKKIENNFDREVGKTQTTEKSDKNTQDREVRKTQE